MNKVDPQSETKSEKADQLKSREVELAQKVKEARAYLDESLQQPDLFSEAPREALAGEPDADRMMDL